MAAKNMAEKVVLAYSGGLDSHVLLHAIIALREGMRDELGGREVMAVHVNHGLSVNAQQWAEHCAKQCEKLGVTFKQVEIDAKHFRDINVIFYNQNTPLSHSRPFLSYGLTV